jgi:PTS system nitrogen regulatory IIA component
VLIETQRVEKPALLRDLCKRAAPVVGVTAQALLADIMRREELGSTGIGQGIALPHTRVASLKEPYSFMVRLAHAIDFDSVDGQPVDLVFFLLLPQSPPNAHLNALACVARALRDPTIQAELRSAADAASLYRAITKSLAQHS